jgi:hypothetical protein
VTISWASRRFSWALSGRRAPSHGVRPTQETFGRPCRLPQNAAASLRRRISIKNHEPDFAVLRAEKGRPQCPRMGPGPADVRPTGMPAWLGISRLPVDIDLLAGTSIPAVPSRCRASGLAPHLDLDWPVGIEVPARRSKSTGKREMPSHPDMPVGLTSAGPAPPLPPPISGPWGRPFSRRRTAKSGA